MNSVVVGSKYLWIHSYASFSFPFFFVFWCFFHRSIFFGFWIRIFLVRFWGSKSKNYFGYALLPAYVGLFDETSSGPDLPLPTLIWILVWAIFIFLLTGDPAVFSPNIPSSSSSSVFRIGLSRKTGSESSLVGESVFEDSSFWTSVVSVTEFRINHKIGFLSHFNPISHHWLSFCL